MPEANTILQGRYRIIRQLGHGGMSTVFEAIDERVNRSVVLKRASFGSADRIKNFEREAQLLANLRHPALPQVSDHFIERGSQYLVMDFIPGNDLAELLALLGRPFPLPDVMRWTDDLLKVLEYLHRHTPPILHRDIKPANLKLTKDGEVFLLDFGLAKGSAGQMPTIGAMVQSIAGYTPNYAPLEQILRADGESGDHFYIDALSSRNSIHVEKILQSETDVRADLYSLAATIYHLLTNEVPCNAARRTLLVWDGQPDPIRPATEANPLIPEEVSRVLQASMSLLVDQRPPSATAMRIALREAGLSTRLSARIALEQLSQPAVESIVQTALERFSEQILPDVTQTREEIAKHKRRIEKLEVQNQQLVDELREATRPEKSVSLEELEPDVIQSIVSQAAEQFSRNGRLERLTESIIKEFLEKEPTPAPAQKRAGSISEAVEEGKRLYMEEKRKNELHDVRSPPIKLRNEEEDRLHKNARRFAKLLTSEIKIYNELKVKAGRNNNDIYDRLREDIDRSRMMYDKRIAPSVRAEYDYFHHELVTMLAEGNPIKMGKNYPGEIIR
ncbi:MAG TPA: protein kinase [Pyrinomonadaceae bacterium]|nr:protein kinase [Pyrinomonadaceae bacterium]